MAAAQKTAGLDSREVSILNNVDVTYSTTDSPLYNSAGTDVSTAVQLTAPDGAIVDTTSDVVTYSVDIGNGTYGNIEDSLNPVSVVYGHQDQLPYATPYLDGDNNVVYPQFQQYTYEFIDGSGSDQPQGPADPFSGGSPSNTSGGNDASPPTPLSPADVDNIPVPDNTELYADGDDVYAIVNGQVQGFVAVEDSTGQPSPGFETLPGDPTYEDQIVGTTPIDPVSAANVQLDYVTDLQAPSDTVSIPQTVADTGHAVLDGVSQWWNNGGGEDIASGNVGSLLELSASEHPVQQLLLDKLNQYTDVSNYNVYQTNTGDPVQDDFNGFLNDVRGPLRDIISDGIKGMVNFGESVKHFKSIGNVIKDFELNLLHEFQTGADQITTGNH